MLFLGIFDFFNNVKNLQIISSILLVSIILIIVFFIKKNSKYKKTLYLIFSVIDDKAEIQVKDIIYKTKKIEDELNNSKIKEYNTKVSVIKKKYNDLIANIVKIYDNELKDKKKKGKEKLSKITDKQEKIQTKEVINEEIKLRKKAKKIELEKINTDKNAELLQLELEYKPVLDYYKQIRLLKKDTKSLLKLIKNVKKHEYKIPNLSDKNYIEDTESNNQNSEQAKLDQNNQINNKKDS